MNFWYAHPIGHAIEALRYCVGYAAANDSLRVSVALNAATPVELARLCPAVDEVFAVPFTSMHDSRGDARAALAEVPREWDWVIDDGRRYQPDQLAAFPGLRRYYEASDAHFVVQRGRGAAGQSPPPYVPNRWLRLALPSSARRRAEEALGRGGRRIAVLPAGSGPRHAYPSLRSWRLVLERLREAFPDARLCLVGKLARDERTFTALGGDELAALRAICDAAAVDRPLVDQLAIVSACDVFVAPHTGFGMAASAVGTPWLALSGGRWPEYFFNGVPFYSVLPDPKRYPAYEGLSTPVRLVDDDGARIPSMTHARIVEDLPELLDAARELAVGRLSYERALADHFRRLLAFHGGDRTRIWSFDGIHERYV